MVPLERELSAVVESLYKALGRFYDQPGLDASWSICAACNPQYDNEYEWGRMSLWRPAGLERIPRIQYRHVQYDRCPGGGSIYACCCMIQPFLECLARMNSYGWQCRGKGCWS